MEEEVNNEVNQEEAPKTEAEESAPAESEDATEEDIQEAATGETSAEESKEESRNDDRKMYPAKCSECGEDCEVPFEPEEGKSVKCKECFMKSRPKRSFNNNRGGGGNRGFDRGDRGPREMHDAKCTKCGKSCQVPFKPTPGKDVLCQDCFRANRN